jgi:PAS domain S-box-containing protein
MNREHSPAAAFEAAAQTARAAPGRPAHPRTPIPSEFEGLARLAAFVCQTPFASIVLVDWGRAWCGSAQAAPPPTLLDHDPFFEYTAQAATPLEVPDTALDPRFSAVACATGASAVRSYFGCALRTAGGELLGTLAVYDTAVRRYSVEQRVALGALAGQCVAQAELRIRVAELELVCAAQRGTTAADAESTLVRALLESAPVAIYHADTTNKVSYVNREYRRIFNLSEQQSTNDWALGIHPEDRTRIEELWADFCRRPRSMRFEYRSLPTASAVRYFAEQVAPADGIPGYVGTITDFTDLVTARGDLRKAESLLHNTFDQAPIGIAYADRDGRFLRYNAAFCSLLGFTPDEFAQQSTGALTHPDDRAAADAQLDRLWDGEIQHVDIEKRYLRKDGRPIWVRTTTALVREDGAADWSVEYLRDITQRKELAAQLLQQQTLLEAVLAELPVALLVSDGAGNLTHYNRAAMQMYCIAPAAAAAAGTNPADPYPLAAHVYLADGVTPVPRAQRPLARALRGETISNWELVIAPYDASPPRTTLSNARRLIGPAGQTLGAVAVVQDITERKHQELELERVHKELMTASRQAGMAEVATNVLHNVGNILNSVNISASLVAERVRQSKAPGVARLAALLLEQGPKLGHFIADDERGRRIPEYLGALGEQLLTDQRMALTELGSLRENLEHIKDTVAMQQSYAKRCGVTETVEVVDLVEDSLRLNAGAFARHGVTLKRDFGAVPPLTVDKHKVLQILVNLIRNAKYACDDSGRTDKLIILRIETAARGVRIAVIDNGVGIPAENMGRLFSHGFTTRQSGHGFGLHSGALAAQELGGTLHAESGGAGCGASFILELPLEPPDEARAAAGRAPAGRA